MLALAEQEAQTKAVIGKNYKARRKALKELQKVLGDKIDGDPADFSK